jgi:hypothetical protein
MRRRVARVDQDLPVPEGLAERKRWARWEDPTQIKSTLHRRVCATNSLVLVAPLCYLCVLCASVVLWRNSAER